MAQKHAKKTQDTKSSKTQKTAASSATRATKTSKKTKGVSGFLTFLLALLALAAGIAIGRFVLGGGLSATNEVEGKLTLTADELDLPVASVTYNGVVHNISARDAILSAGSLETNLNADGSYTMPSADSILSLARNEILNQIVEERGISVTEEEVEAYALEMLGISDYATIAEQFGLDEEAAHKMIAESAAIGKLYDEVVDADALEPPEPPTYAEEGQEDVPNAEYGAYIVNLLGDEWDSEANTWARDDGPYYAALSAEDFSSEAGTYNQAETAYYVAYQVYATDYSNVTAQWTDFVNEKLSHADIEIFSLVS